MINISVIIPTYNSALFISNAIYSLLNQTMKPFEVIIVDDGSTDNTCEVISNIINKKEELNLRIIKGLHKGPGSARNIGIKASKSKWIAFLDSDDLWSINKIKNVSEAIKENIGYTFFCHNEKLVCSNKPTIELDYSKKYDEEINLSKQLYKSNLFSTSAVVCLKEDLLKVGGFDEKLSSAQDYDLWLKMSSIIKPFFINQVLGTYNLRNGNISSTNHFKRLINISKVMIRHKNKGGFYFYFNFIKIPIYYIITPTIILLKASIYKYKNKICPNL
jgi:glycosyltransferase involved in cell wall biosynthesis